MYVQVYVHYKIQTGEQDLQPNLSTVSKSTHTGTNYCRVLAASKLQTRQISVYTTTRMHRTTYYTVSNMYWQMNQLTECEKEQSCYRCMVKIHVCKEMDNGSKYSKCMDACVRDSEE